MPFPVDQLTAESRCLLADVIDHPSAFGMIGSSGRHGHADAALGHGIVSDHATRAGSVLGE
jgi:hypothetical protein